MTLHTAGPFARSFRRSSPCWDYAARSIWSARRNFRSEFARTNTAPGYPDKLAKQRDEARASTVAIMRDPQKNLATSFGVIFSAGIAGVAVAQVIGSPATKSTNAFLGLLSAALFAWATLAKLEWLQGSYGGATIFEALDRLIFRLLYWLGMINPRGSFVSRVLTGS